ncbi:hypothetical protein PO124_08905 [Bacillus licheniformis]|nr:hypothetical protein [Bacillus licheniformis]
MMTVRFRKSIRHDEAELQQYQTIIDQYSFRKQAILETLHEQGINISKLDAVCARGGLLRPIEGGTYEVNDAMIVDLKTAMRGSMHQISGHHRQGDCRRVKYSRFIVDPLLWMKWLLSQNFRHPGY